MSPTMSSSMEEAKPALVSAWSSRSSRGVRRPSSSPSGVGPAWVWVTWPGPAGVADPAGDAPLAEGGGQRLQVPDAVLEADREAVLAEDPGRGCCRRRGRVGVDQHDRDVGRRRLLRPGRRADLDALIAGDP